MSLTNEQEQAAKILIDRLNSGEKVSILQGPAGSGKTFLLNYLIDYLGYEYNKIAFAAYTGTAAKVLMNQGLNASTIHGLIYDPIIWHGRCTGFKLKTTKKLRHLKLIIIDEFSMLPQNLLVDLMSFNIPLILVGDQFQLPPIGQPNKFIHNAHATLTEPMRQALDNPVLYIANEIRQRKSVPYGVYGEDKNTGQVLVTSRFEIQQEWKREDVKIIVGLNKTRNELNTEIAASTVPIAGHKIIFLKNDWKTMIVNGTIATILDMKQISGTRYKLKFITEEDYIYEDYLADFQTQTKAYHQFFDLAYAITCHKAQGATYDAPGLIFDESSYFRENKYKWLYTAVSRFTGNYNVAIVR